ncbi:hypothetical protein WA026_023616 [Henosepilachna vigintioctopunctata]|uniref:Uncharacterized protein n=1 Tax=Henosepilachna vigintioctopunctata TaxID=420089 RepID=A0AAW1TZ36_9CUCU
MFLLNAIVSTEVAADIITVDTIFSFMTAIDDGLIVETQEQRLKHTVKSNTKLYVLRLETSPRSQITAGSSSIRRARLFHMARANLEKSLQHSVHETVDSSELFEDEVDSHHNLLWKMFGEEIEIPIQKTIIKNVVRTKWKI